MIKIFRKEIILIFFSWLFQVLLSRESVPEGGDMSEPILQKLAAEGNLDKIIEKPKAFCFLP